ncbi:MAG: VWA domain-containing protein, partial [bacterium]|nr:VWA domain-containing protein [bacterium]
MKIGRGFPCAAFALTLSMTMATPASAQESAEPTTIVLVLDASGSMWGQIDGVAKIQIAKQTLLTIITDLPDDAEVGLILYGHRKKGDCDDVELVASIGRIDKAGLKQKVQAINPKGKTPITRSIQEAGEALRTIEGAATVVLVSDGEETCDADPCVATRLL